jgi:hypothetical protein
MPNWCNNTISIKGSTNSIKDLWVQASICEGLLQAIKPMPEILEGTTSPAPDDLDPVLRRTMIAQTGTDNWYDWCVKNWGVKWDVSLEGLEFTDNGDGTAEISGWFDSPWGPPIEAYQQFADDFDSCYLEAFYDEPGMVFVGCWDSEGGDDYYEYSDCTSKTLKDIVPDYLIEHFGLDERMAEWEEEEEMV